MIGKLRFMTLVTLAAMTLSGSTACTPLQEGFQSGVSDGIGAALTALIETPITFLLEQALATDASGG